jgi:hypothetical protein
MQRIILRFVVVVALCTLVSGRVWAAAGKEGPMAKVDHALAAVYDEYESYWAQGGGAVFTSSNPLLRVSAGRVVVDAVASGDVHTLQADLEALGMQGAVTFGRIVSGQLPIAAIEGMAALASLQFARPAYATTNVGLATSQGDQAMRSDVARATFAVDGTGVMVGVLSNSFDCLGGAAADVANDDLAPVTVIQELPNCTGATDEGRAMLQLVHDVAPGASLAFATAGTGQAGFASNILALQAFGAGVVVDDIIYFAESMFQDGIIAQAVDTVEGMGVPYFSSAGNSARQSYESSFRAGPFFADGAFPSAPGAPHFFGVRRMTSTRGRAKTFSSASQFPPALCSPSLSSGIHRLLPSAPAVPAHPTISTSTCSMTRPRPLWPAAQTTISVGTRWRSSAS